MTIPRSYHALSPTQQRGWKLLRYILPRRVRWFFEGCVSIQGQLWYADRKLLYQTIRDVKPETVFEVGTWYGGGSTYFISHALYENACGVLHTIEADPQVHSIAVESYRKYLPHLLPHVRFHKGRAKEIYPGLLRELRGIDAVFLDGAQDAEETLVEFQMFAPHLTTHSILLMHDWDNDKMALLRPRMEESTEWLLQQTITAPHSVGFAVWMHA